MSDTLLNMALGRTTEDVSKEEMIKNFSTWAGMAALKLAVSKIAEDSDESAAQIMNGLLNLWAAEQKAVNDAQITHMKAFMETPAGIMTQSLIGDPDEFERVAQKLLDETIVDLRASMLDNLS